MILNQFIDALHEDERELARKFQDEYGTDWNAYILEKEKAGFCKFDEWQFMDYSHLCTQMKSKYTTKWGTRLTNVMINDRKIEIQFFVAGFRPVKKDCHHNLYGALHAREDDEDEQGGTENGKRLIQELIGPFQSVGHGVNFCATMEANEMERPMVFKLCEGKSMYDLKAFTVIWINHNLMVLILHEDKVFVDAKE